MAATESTSRLAFLILLLLLLLLSVVATFAFAPNYSFPSFLMCVVRSFSSLRCNFQKLQTFNNNNKNNINNEESSIDGEDKLASCCSCSLVFHGRTVTQLLTCLYAAARQRII